MVTTDSTPRARATCEVSQGHRLGRLRKFSAGFSRQKHRNNQAKPYWSGSLSPFGEATAERGATLTDEQQLPFQMLKKNHKRGNGQHSIIKSF